jgi:branched-chain amino acid aminotransferase
MEKVETLAWFDGDILPVQEIRVSPLAHSLHYGTGIFEGMRCYAQQGGGGGIFRLQDHLARLFDSARILGYEIPFSAQELALAAREVVRRNAMETAYLRPLAWLGEGQMGVAGGANPVHVMIAVCSAGSECRSGPTSAPRGTPRRSARRSRAST